MIQHTHISHQNTVFLLCLRCCRALRTCSLATLAGICMQPQCVSINTGTSGCLTCTPLLERRHSAATLVYTDTHIQWKMWIFWVHDFRNSRIGQPTAQRSTAFLQSLLAEPQSGGEQIAFNPCGFSFFLENVSANIKCLTQILGERSQPVADSSAKHRAYSSTRKHQLQCPSHPPTTPTPTSEQSCIKSTCSQSSQQRLSNFVGKDLQSGPGNKNPLMGSIAIRTQVV